MSIIITCEHAGNIVPPEYSYLFSRTSNILKTHRGYDPGALEMASRIAERLNCLFVYETTSRLLIDQNRSVTNKRLWSDWSEKLSSGQKSTILEKIYKPYHDKVTEFINQNIADKKIIYHFSIHTFTSELDGIVRNCDAGLLYDPSLKSEKILSDKLACGLKEKVSGIRIRKNYPYKGISDGLTKELRKKYGVSYCGIEVELNQKEFLGKTAMWNMISKELPECIVRLLSVKADIQHRPI